jgi:lycopene cyclase domain-containing protein
MTYLHFLLIFLIPPILVLLFTLPRPLARIGGSRARWALPLVALIAFAYTTPWDNYLVYRQVWTYGPERVLGVLGYVPLEEYAFFILQPLLTGLAFYHLLARSTPVLTYPSWLFLPILFFCIAITAIGGFLLVAGPSAGLYLGLILAWSGPILVGLWGYGGRMMLRHHRPAGLALLLTTPYLWLIDRIAIGVGIWDIADRYSFDLDPLGLPVEEAIFFLVTNLLVVQGVLLFLYGDQVGTTQRTPAP